MPSRAAIAYKGGARLARAMPESVAFALARFLGAQLAPRIAGARREQVERNLRRVHGPDLSDAELHRGVQATFGSYARYWAESFRLPGTTREALDARMRVEGFEHIEAARAEGKGVILAMPHLGSWEWGGFWLSRAKDIPVTVVVERLDPPDVFEWFVELRRSFGLEVVPLGPAAGNATLVALRANRVLGLLCDRDIGGGGIEVDFFGERTTLPGGPATLALRTGAPILPTAVYHEGDTHVARIRPPLDTARTGKLRADVSRVTQLLADELEALIRAAPDQWHLLMPNWPSDPGFQGRIR